MAIECPYCYRTYANREGARSHLRHHHLGQQIPFHNECREVSREPASSGLAEALSDHRPDANSSQGVAVLVVRPIPAALKASPKISVTQAIGVLSTCTLDPIVDLRICQIEIVETCTVGATTNTRHHMHVVTRSAQLHRARPLTSEIGIAIRMNATIINQHGILYRYEYEPQSYRGRRSAQQDHHRSSNYDLRSSARRSRYDQSPSPPYYQSRHTSCKSSRTRQRYRNSRAFGDSPSPPRHRYPTHYYDEGWDSNEDEDVYDRRFRT